MAPGGGKCFGGGNGRMTLRVQPHDVRGGPESRSAAAGNGIYSCALRRHFSVSSSSSAANGRGARFRIAETMLRATR